MFCFVTVPGLPRAVQCGKSTSKSLSVSWLEPGNPNGVIRGYRVSWEKIKNINSEENDPVKNPGRDETTNRILTNIGRGKLGKL